MVVSVALLGVVVLVDALAAVVAPAPDSGAVSPVLLVWIADEKSGSSWCNMICNRTGAASVTTTLFSTMLVVDLGSVLILGLSLDGW